MRPSKRALANLALSLASLLLFALLAEFVVFRGLLAPSDVPVVAMADDLIRYRPQQSGVWRIQNEIAAPFAINAQGWNSGRGDYALPRSLGVGRVVIVGDSFVEALQVPADSSLAEQLEALLKPAPWEVFRFGVSGAPMSQYLLMLEREVARYRPDLAVVVVAHNDFGESYQFMPGRYTSSFRKLEIRDGRVVREIPPQAYAPPAWDWLRQSALARYFYYRWGVRAETLRARLLAPPPEPVAANVAVTSMQADMALTKVATEHLFGRMAEWAKGQGAKLLIVMDGDRQSIYAGTASAALQLNELAGATAARFGIDFIDLHPRFAADWAQNQQRFDFVSDNHWNIRGHALAARAIADYANGAGFRP